jgi:WhiB family transcriptional regulator, redox-sensing transcriptional regulator
VTTRRSAWGLDHDHGDWRDRAACRGEDPELWFADGHGPGWPPSAEEVRAKAICSGCPVAAACLSWALTHAAQAKHGVWGGMSAAERDAVLRRRHRIGDPVITRALRDTRVWYAVQQTREVPA